jgi:hypothetical protein
MTKPLFLACSSLLFVAACSTGPDRRAVVVADAGTLVVDWTVDGVKDPAECDQGHASTIDITVQTADGADVGEFQADCGEFSTSIDLDPGSYIATAVLIDASGHDATTPVDLNPFRIRGNDVLTTPIDFPAGSFL